jgi:Ca2+-binding EF-hand superfamily protein
MERPSMMSESTQKKFFHRMKHVKKTYLNTEAEKANDRHIGSLFTQFDKDASGCLDASELCSLYNENDVPVT